MALIYILEDDRNIREIEEIALKNADYEVVSFETAAEFGKRLKERVPDLLLLDLMLPDADGLRLVTQLRQNVMTMSLPVIMVTAKTTEIDKVRGLDSGADDYIPKPFRMMELISRIKARLRRAEDKGAEEYHLENLYLCPGRHIVTVDQEPVNLTLKEYEMLVLLLKNSGMVLSRTQLLNQIWGYEFDGESRTVDVHIRRLREKIETNPSEPKYVHTKWGVGYYFQA